MKIELKALLKEMVSKNASDLHFKIGLPPVVRIKRELIKLPDYPLLTRKDILELAFSLMDDVQKALFEKNKEIDLAFGVEGIGRFRANFFKQCGEPGFVLRFIKDTIPSFEELSIPPVFKKLSALNHGLILITGATSQGKSTTLACMLDYINQTKSLHIVTVEDPIEYLHLDKKSIIRQREVGLDTASFDDALRNMIRQDPNVILIGEMRDVQTFRAAIAAADTGHLVLSTLHSSDTIQALNRIIDLFPSEFQKQTMIQLSQNLRAITCQRLLKRLPNEGLIPAFEILIADPAVTGLIREGKLDKIKNVMQNSANEGMQTFNQALFNLIQEKKITLEEALAKSDNPEALSANLKGIFFDEDRGVLGD
jgi:pilus retraction protein PilT